MSTFQLVQFHREQWLAQKLGLTFPGDTTADERREKVRRHILDGNLWTQVLGHSPTKGVIICADAFQSTYGEPLVPGSGGDSRGGPVQLTETVAAPGAIP